MATSAEIGGLCNYGTLLSQYGRDLHIEASGLIINYTEAQILGQEGQSGIGNACGQDGSSVELRGSPFFNMGTIRSGQGGSSEACGGDGGYLMVLAQNTVNTGTICGGNGGNILSNLQGAYGGRGGQTHIWGKYRQYGGTLINTGTSCGGDGGSTLTSEQKPGAGGRLKLISLPNVYLQCGIHYGGNGGCRADSDVCARDGSVIIEPTQFCLASSQISGWNVTVFGGANATINLGDTANVINARNDITLATGNGGTIIGDTNKAFTARGSVSVLENTWLSDVSLIGPDMMFVTPGITVAEQLTILNGGPLSATYTLEVTDKYGWEITGIPAEVTLEGITTLDIPFQVLAETQDTNELTVVLRTEDGQQIVEELTIQVAPLNMVGINNVMLMASHNEIPADGRSTIDITITVQDSNNNPLANQPVEIQTTMGRFVIGDGITTTTRINHTTDSKGTAVVTLQSVAEMQGTAEITAQSGDVRAEPIHITFGPYRMYLPHIMR
jgi:hypothetical protein